MGVERWDLHLRQLILLVLVPYLTETVMGAEMELEMELEVGMPKLDLLLLDERQPLPQPQRQEGEGERGDYLSLLGVL